MSAITLPGSWATVKLSEVGTWRGGGTPSKANPAFWTDGTIPWVSPKDMKLPRLSTAQDLITKAAVESSATNIVAAGSVLLVTRSGILAHSLPIAVNLVPVALNQDIKAVTPHSITDAEFLRLTFQCFERDILNTCRKGGTTVHSIEFPALQDFTIPLPPLPEQKRIVGKIGELFSEMEAGEESLRVARRQLGVYRQSLLKQAFEGKLTAKWRTQNPGKLESPATLLSRIQAARRTSTGGEAALRRSRKQTAETILESRLVESLSKLPDSWQWTALGNLTHLITKGSSPKWQGFDYTNDPSGVLFVTSENVRTGFLDLSRPKYLGLGFNEIQPASVLQDGDVLLNIVGASIGRAATFHGATLANINQAVSLIRPTRFLDQAFLTYHLNSSRTYQLVTAKAVDVARANFSLADVNEIPIPLCSLPEQQEIVRLLDAQFEVIERNEREIDGALWKSEALRQAILKRAFTGRLVPQRPADELASALLARLRAERAFQPTKKKART